MRATVSALFALAFFAAPTVAQVPVNVESTPPGATVFLDTESDASRRCARCAWGAGRTP